MDLTEHDVQVVVTEQGLAGLRGLSPRQRAHLIIEKGADPGYKASLLDYLNRFERLAYGKHTPHLWTEALGWHTRYLPNATCGCEKRIENIRSYAEQIAAPDGTGDGQPR